MAIPLYLAKTAAEFAVSAPHPQRLAWMACHFSPYATGITNLPDSLPPDSLLILNDRTPAHGHDPSRIHDTLMALHNELNYSGILLDFQRPDCAEAEQIIQAILTLPCPVCVSDIYSKHLDCPVFLPPVPLTMPPEEYLSNWKGREIWLEVSKECLCVSITKNGTEYTSMQTNGDFPHRDSDLHCRYRSIVEENIVKFCITRNDEDLESLLKAASQHGVTKAVGLWQEFK